MKEIELKYGCNPNQKPGAHLHGKRSELPVEVLNGPPGLYKLYGCAQLLAAGTRPAPRDGQARCCQLQARLACRSGDRFPAFGRGQGALSSQTASSHPLPRPMPALAAPTGSVLRDWAALSEVCDETAASLLLPEVSDGIIAPGYTPGALEILRQKRKGGYNVVKIDPDYEPKSAEQREHLRHPLEQGYNSLPITRECLGNIVTKNKAPNGQRRGRPASRAHHAQVHAVKLRLLCPGGTDRRRRRRPAEPHPLHPSRRR